MNSSTQNTTDTLSRTEQLREGIRSENKKARSAARKSLEHVRACGEMLTELKEKAPHGDWMLELKMLGIERRTASNYMRIADKWETVSHLNGGVRDALKLLSSGDNPPPSPTPPSPTLRQPSSPLTVDAEIVEDSSEDPEQPKPASTRINYVPSDAMGIYYLAKSHMEKIHKSDTERVEALEAMITYCQKRISQKH